MRFRKGKTTSLLVESMAQAVCSVARGKVLRKPDWTRAVRAAEVLLRGGAPSHFEKALEELLKDSMARKTIFKVVKADITERRIA